MNFQSISPDVKLGENVKIYNFVNLYGCEVGDNTKIGVFVEIQKNARVGKNCKISSHTFICEGVTIEDNVFIGHSVVFINDTYPRATNGNGGLQTEEDWKVEPILVKSGASIGSNCTILSNVAIGENAIVGAGSVVTRDVPPNMIVAGNPARIFRTIDFLTQTDMAEQFVLYEFLRRSMQKDRVMNREPRSTSARTAVIKLGGAGERGEKNIVNAERRLYKSQKRLP